MVFVVVIVVVVVCIGSFSFLFFSIWMAQEKPIFVLMGVCFSVPIFSFPFKKNLQQVFEVSVVIRKSAFRPQCYLWFKALDIYISHPFQFFSLPLWGVNVFLCFVSCLSVLCVFVASSGAYSEWLNPLLVVHSLGKALLNLIIRFSLSICQMITPYWQFTDKSPKVG